MNERIIRRWEIYYADLNPVVCMRRVGMGDAKGMNTMTDEHALSELKRMYDDIDKDNHLFVGTIPPEMIAIAIEALEVKINALDNK